MHGCTRIDGRTTFRRGQLSLAGTTVPPYAALSHATLTGEQHWSNLDSRGNWHETSRKLNGVTTLTDHVENIVNEITQVDPDTGDANPAVNVDVDANGNMTWDRSAPNVGAADGQRYEYDAANRLSSIWRTNDTETTADDQLLAEYVYDALGRRVQTNSYIDETDGTVLSTPKFTWHIFSGLAVIEEYDVVGTTATLAREFVWGARFPEPVAMIDHTDAGDQTGAGEVVHFLLDVLGSVVALTDSAGDVVERFEYDPYGRTFVSDVTASGAHDDATYRHYSRFGNPFAWTGQRYDPATSLYHFWARSYSPRLGHWLQRDPMEYINGNTSAVCNAWPIEASR